LLELIVSALQHTNDARTFARLTEAAQSLTGDLTVEQTRSTLAVVRPVLAWEHTRDKAAAWATAFAMLLSKNHSENYVADIVEVLKYPTLAGPATDVMLDALRDIDARAPGREAGLAASLEWLRTTYPSIDLDARPHCPSPLEQRDVACPVLN
jgi:hypothetical protein